MGAPATDTQDQTVKIASLESKSGTRLRHQIARAEDGSQISLGLFDTKLGQQCAFAEAEDGKQRCLPTNVARVWAPDFLNSVNSGALVLYRDMNCSERIAFSSLCAQAVRYIRYSDTCGSKTRIAQALEIPMPNALYQRGTTGACSSTSTAYAAYKELRAYVFGPNVPPDEFVAGSVTVE